MPDEEPVPRQFGDHADIQTVGGIGSAEEILHPHLALQDDVVVRAVAPLGEAVLHVDAVHLRQGLLVELQLARRQVLVHLPHARLAGDDGPDVVEDENEISLEDGADEETQRFETDNGIATTKPNDEATATAKQMEAELERLIAIEKTLKNSQRTQQ